MKKKVFNYYADNIAELFGLNKKDIFTKTKSRDVVDARYMLYYLCYERPMDVTYIIKFMGDNGYDIARTNIHYGIKEMKKKIVEDVDLSMTFKNIQEGA